MNIALCTDTFYPVMGGTEFVVDRLAREYSKMGHKVAVFTYNFIDARRRFFNEKYITPDHYKTFPYQVITTRAIYMKLLYGYYGAPSFDKNFYTKLSDFKPDAIHAHTPFSIGKWAMASAKKLNVESIMTYHTKFAYSWELSIPFGFDNIIHRTIVSCLKSNIRRSLKKADIVTTVSRNCLSNELNKALGIDKNCIVIQNGFDLIGTFNPSESLHLCDATKFRMIYAGRIDKEKNLKFSFEVIRKCVDAGVPISFALAGDGKDTAFFKTMSEKMGISENTEWIGRINKDELYKQYLKSDAMLFPSIFDNDSIAALEARSCGLPTLTIDGTGTAERIKDGINGYVLKEDAADFANKIAELWNMKKNNPDEYLCLKKSTSDLKPDTWNKIALQYLKLYSYS